MSLAFSVVWLFAPCHRKQFKFLVHVFMNGCRTEINLLTAQKYTHAAVAQNTVVFVIDSADYSANLRFL